MAWRSSGTTNDEMVDNLKRFCVISSLAVERGFRNVDRRYFVPKEREDMAHADQPLQERNIHISAPHIYGSALEALDLTPNSTLSFLNVGSGTGYMSCIVAAILGSCSTNYGIEIHQDVVDHCNAAIASWKSTSRGGSGHLQIIQGDALNVALDQGEAIIGFDRIYIGASVHRRCLPKLRSLLKTGGILVGPVGDELVKITRTNHSSDDGEHTDDFSQEILSGVRFKALLEVSSAKTIIQSRVWSPSVHKSYPKAFRIASKELLLCSHAPYVQQIPLGLRPTHQVNVAAVLPRAIWLEILSYTHHNWFEPPQSEVSYLKQRLAEEQEISRKANEAHVKAEARCHVAERERDVYRLLARRWQSRLQLILHSSNLEDGRTEMDTEDANQEVNDEEEFENGNYLFSDDDDDEEDSEVDSDSDDEGDVDNSAMSLNHDSPTGSPVLTRRQVRTVSIFEEY